MDARQRQANQRVSRIIDELRELDITARQAANAAEWKWTIREHMDGIPNNYELQALHSLAWETWQREHDRELDEGKTIRELSDDERRALAHELVEEMTGRMIRQSPATLDATVDAVLEIARELHDLNRTMKGIRAAIDMMPAGDNY